MRILTLTAAALLVAAPAMASLTDGYSTTGRSPGAPLDRGPYTAEANRAYMGGGMVQESAPGMTQAPMTPAPMAPAPMQRDMNRPMR